ncbi:hypothetical protein F4212_06475 [Candidatus Poribacteria bacterium]|nr:hypothetical protein [Candidatus Poribacteria bacterium]
MLKLLAIIIFLVALISGASWAIDLADGLAALIRITLAVGFILICGLGLVCLVAYFQGPSKD